jgi:hypothetical protein
MHLKTTVGKKSSLVQREEIQSLPRSSKPIAEWEQPSRIQQK